QRGRACGLWGHRGPYVLLKRSGLFPYGQFSPGDWPEGDWIATRIPSRKVSTARVREARNSSKLWARAPPDGPGDRTILSGCRSADQDQAPHRLFRLLLRHADERFAEEDSPGL